MADEKNKDETENHRPPEEGQSILDLTEEMADRALQKLRETASLPRVAEEASTKATRFVSSLDTFGLRLVIGLYLSTAVFGTVVALVGVSPIGTLPDWMMHVAMYGVCFGLLALYTTARRAKRKFARTIFCLVAVSSFLAFSAILFDRVEERLVFLENDVGTDATSAMRPRMTLLWGPAGLLIVCALSVLMHWGFTGKTTEG